jgi:hypothetical protein
MVTAATQSYSASNDSKGYLLIRMEKGTSSGYTWHFTVVVKAPGSY